MAKRAPFAAEEISARFWLSFTASIALRQLPRSSRRPPYQPAPLRYRLARQQTMAATPGLEGRLAVLFGWRGRLSSEGSASSSGLEDQAVPMPQVPLYQRNQQRPAEVLGSDSEDELCRQHAPRWASPPPRRRHAAAANHAEPAHPSCTAVHSGRSHVAALYACSRGGSDSGSSNAQLCQPALSQLDSSDNDAGVSQDGTRTPQWLRWARAEYGGGSSSSSCSSTEGSDQVQPSPSGRSDLKRKGHPPPSVREEGAAADGQSCPGGSPRVPGSGRRRHPDPLQHRSSPPRHAARTTRRSLAGELQGAAAAAPGPLPAFTVLPVLVPAEAAARVNAAAWQALPVHASAAGTDGTPTAQWTIPTGAGKPALEEQAGMAPLYADGAVGSAPCRSHPPWKQVLAGLAIEETTRMKSTAAGCVAASNDTCSNAVQPAVAAEAARAPSFCFAVQPHAEAGQAPTPTSKLAAQDASLRPQRPSLLRRLFCAAQPRVRP